MIRQRDVKPISTGTHRSISCECGQQTVVSSITRGRMSCPSCGKEIHISQAPKPTNRVKAPLAPYAPSVKDKDNE